MSSPTNLDPSVLKTIEIWSLKKLKDYCCEHNITIPPKCKKRSPIITTIRNCFESKAPKTRKRKRETESDLLQNPFKKRKKNPANEPSFVSDELLALLNEPSSSPKKTIKPPSKPVSNEYVSLRENFSQSESPSETQSQNGMSKDEEDMSFLEKSPSKPSVLRATPDSDTDSESSSEDSVEFKNSFDVKESKPLFKKKAEPVLNHKNVSPKPPLKIPKSSKVRKLQKKLSGSSSNSFLKKYVAETVARDKQVRRQKQIGFLIGILSAVLIGISIKKRYEIEYCDTHIKWRERDLLNLDCVLCPENADCIKGNVFCRDELEFDGEKCVVDEEKQKILKSRIAEAIYYVLAENKGNFICQNYPFYDYFSWDFDGSQKLSTARVRFDNDDLLTKVQKKLQKHVKKQIFNEVLGEIEQIQERKKYNDFVDFENVEVNMYKKYDLSFKVDMNIISKIIYTSPELAVSADSIQTVPCRLYGIFVRNTIKSTLFIILMVYGLMKIYANLSDRLSDREAERVKQNIVDYLQDKLDKKHDPIWEPKEVLQRKFWGNGDIRTWKRVERLIECDPNIVKGQRGWGGTFRLCWNKVC